MVVSVVAVIGSSLHNKDKEKGWMDSTNDISATKIPDLGSSVLYTVS